MKCTQAQLDALYQIYLRWQDKTPHAIMPVEFELIGSEEYLGDSAIYPCIGVWVGTAPSVGHEESENRHGALYLGIEYDGHTHS